MASDPTEHRVSPLVMGVAYLGLGFIMLLPPVMGIFTLRRLLYARETLNWPKTPAVVTRSELETTWDRRKKFVEAKIEFVYELDGTKRVGTKPYRNHGRSAGAGQWQHQQFLDRFPVGTRTTASYNPRDPNEAYLVPGAQWSDYVLLAPWLFVAVEIYLIARLVSKWRRSLPTQSMPTANP